MELMTFLPNAIHQLFTSLGPAIAFGVLMYFLLIHFEHRHEKERKLWMEMNLKEREERALARREDEAAMRLTLENMSKVIDARAAETNAVILSLTKAVTESSAKQDAYMTVKPVKTVRKTAPKRKTADA